MMYLAVDCHQSADQPLDLQFEADLSGLVVILGANGAGKTSFLETIHGMRSTSARWNHIPAASSKSSRGFVAQRPIFLSGSVRKNLEYSGRLLNLSKDARAKRIEALSARLNLQHLLDQNTSQLSGGEATRLALVQAQIHAPKTLLLDEVTAHLDPENTKAFEKFLREFANKPEHLAMFVTHSLAQARRLADYILFLDHGSLAFHGDAHEFWQQTQSTLIERFKSGELS